ncbi:MAG: hypothetical protein F2563_03190 [Actinobacteria bacterium]|uniref:Unannotated protein n=1 Tax=freshwater metagenome TaxID=449393 RepID=A0A6J6EP57_9ZZZZ|nr:hypothetical protein [Actinomycetota bacterium]
MQTIATKIGLFLNGLSHKSKMESVYRVYDLGGFALNSPDLIDAAIRSSIVGGNIEGLEFIMRVCDPTYITRFTYIIRARETMYRGSQMMRFFWMPIIEPYIPIWLPDMRAEILVETRIKILIDYFIKDEYYFNTVFDDNEMDNYSYEIRCESFEKIWTKDVEDSVRYLLGLYPISVGKESEMMYLLREAIETNMKYWQCYGIPKRECYKKSAYIQAFIDDCIASR